MQPKAVVVKPQATILFDLDKRAYDLVCMQSLYIAALLLLRKIVQKSFFDSVKYHHCSNTNNHFLDLLFK